MTISHRSLAAALLLMSIALVSAACGGAGGSPGTSSTPAASDGTGMVDANGDWKLVRGTNDGVAIPIVGGSDITLTVNGSQVGGRSACNRYGGEVVVKDGVVQFGQMMMTEMACAEPVMASEAAYVAALGKVRGAARDGDTLTLTGPGVELTFERVVPPPAAALVDTDWILDSIITGDTVSSVGGEPASLRFAADGTMNGMTGCRRFSGRYQLAGSTVTVTDVQMTPADVPATCPAALQDQDASVMAILSDRFAVAIDGQRLTVTGAGGAGLGYATRAFEIPPAP